MSKETKQVKCVPGDILLMSNPPQYRCVNCKTSWFAQFTVPICRNSPKEDKEECICDNGAKMVKSHIKSCKYFVFPTQVSGWEERFDKGFMTIHRGCDDGFYACPKSEDYFGEYEKYDIKNRPCYCEVEHTKPKIKDFIKYELSQAQKDLLEEIMGKIEGKLRQRFWEGYDAGVNKQMLQEHLSPKEANEIFNSITNFNKGGN